MFCGEPSSQKCSDCSSELPPAFDGFVYFCSTCALRTHTKKSRKDHKLQDAIDTDRLDLYKLDLLSVICIETSHYVCFTRDSNTGTWIFFDSMANRVCKWLTICYQRRWTQLTAANFALLMRFFCSHLTVFLDFSKVMNKLLAGMVDIKR